MYERYLFQQVSLFEHLIFILYPLDDKRERQINKIE